ncbi:glycosyltransferase family 4 protein [Echinicola salinicaeni]|uniref:glycosyltransferase family 4 protein n=1 Tax=Echinicola salinicaeni TaxID=2762757 RepID=UPI001643FD42|nr:glycosyltransferase family 4 protein [Echinicola salinicaeni]
MIRVLFITNGYPTNSKPEFCVFTKEQIEGLNKTGKVESDLIFINSTEDGWIQYIKSILPIVRKSREYEVIHTFHGFVFLLTYFLTFFSRKKIVASFLNNIDKEYKELRYFNYVFSLITKLLIKDNRVFKIFKDKVPSYAGDNSFYLPNGVDLNKFYPIDEFNAKEKLDLDSNVRYILFVSSKDKFRAQKRYDIYLEVLRILKDVYHHDDIRELCLVNTERSKLVYYFNASCLHLLCSDFEGSPNSVKEALACNIPVVSRNVGNVSKMLKGVDGTYVSNNADPKVLAELVDKVLKSSDKFDLRSHLVKSGLDMDSKSEELLALYKNILRI